MEISIVVAAAENGTIGAKGVLSLNNLGLLASLLAIPPAARVSSSAVWICIAVMGVMQGPFIVAQGAITQNWSVAGPERPLAVFIIRLGGNLAKVVASAGTPLLCATRWGWRTVCYTYGGAILAYSLFWNLVAKNSPRPKKAPLLETKGIESAAAGKAVTKQPAAAPARSPTAPPHRARSSCSPQSTPARARLAVTLRTRARTSTARRPSPWVEFV